MLRRSSAGSIRPSLSSVRSPLASRHSPLLPMAPAAATPVIPSEARNLFSPDAEAALMNLVDLRRRIDELDRQLVKLLNERSACALEIGKLKQQGNLPLYQPEREKEVLENAERNNQGPLT